MFAAHRSWMKYRPPPWLNHLLPNLGSFYLVRCSSRPSSTFSDHKKYSSQNRTRVQQDILLADESWRTQDCCQGHSRAPRKDSAAPEAASPQGQCFNLPIGSCHSSLPLNVFTCQSFMSNTVPVYYSPGSPSLRVNHRGVDRNQTLFAIRWKKRTLKSLKPVFLTTCLLASRRRAMTVQKSLLVPGSLLIQYRLLCKQRIRRI